MTTLRLLLLAAACLSAIAVAPAPAAAQEIQITGPLAGQPAVRRMRQYRANRIQLLLPTVGYTLQDQYSRSLMTGLEANVHFTDYLGIGVFGALANFGANFRINTDLTAQVRQNGQTTRSNRLSMPSPDAVEGLTGGFPDQVARLQGLVSLQLVFAPLRGKLSLFQGAFVDTDFYIFAGPALGFVAERANLVGEDAEVCLTDPPPGEGIVSDDCLLTQAQRKNRVAFTGTFGLGLNLYFNDFIGMAIQYRAFPFAINPGGTDEAGAPRNGATVSQPDNQIDGADRRFYYHHMINLGLIITLPPQANLTQ
ncbi:MAG: hypothetical protein ACFCGT_26540 [Sandaracinaceae bacterium]